MRVSVPTEVSMLKPMFHVLCAVTVAAVPILCGVFDSVHTDISLDHYAEKSWSGLGFMVKWLPMPANTFINITYVCAGLYWLIAMHITSKSQNRMGRAATTYLSDHDVQIMYTFCWMGIIYAPVQLLRLLLLRHRLAVMDQWYTLPGFAWVYTMAYHVSHGWSPVTMVTITGISMLSYCLSLISKFGFDIALALHIVFIVKSSWDVQLEHGNVASKSSLIKAVLSCAGFVFLKLADPYLPNLHPFFNYLSGHFWSKLCDALQIYYVGEFFFILMIAKSKKNKIKES